MARQIVSKEATTGDPVVFAMADTYAELSSGYDEYFNPAEWGASSVGIVTGDMSMYMLNIAKQWVALGGE